MRWNTIHLSDRSDWRVDGRDLARPSRLNLLTSFHLYRPTPSPPHVLCPTRLYHHRLVYIMPALPPTVTVTLRNESRQELVLSAADDNKTLSPPSSTSSLLLTPTHGTTLSLHLSTSEDNEKGGADAVEVAISDKNVCLLEGTGSYRVFQRWKGRREVELVVYDKVESASWMSGMRDDVMLSSLNLPGTHVGLLSSSFLS